MPERTWSGLGLEILGPRDFEGEKLRRPGRYVVTFGAAWCGPTRRFVSVFQEWSKGVNARPAIADITDLKSPLWDVFHVKITPTLVCFVEGSADFRLDGRRWIGIRERDLASVALFLKGGTSAANPP